MQRASHAEPDEDNRKFRIFGCTRSAAGFLVRSQSFRPLIGMKEGSFQSGAAASCESEDYFSVAESQVCAVTVRTLGYEYKCSDLIGQICLFTAKKSKY